MSVFISKQEDENLKIFGALGPGRSGRYKARRDEFPSSLVQPVIDVADVRVSFSARAGNGRPPGQVPPEYRDLGDPPPGNAPLEARREHFSITGGLLPPCRTKRPVDAFQVSTSLPQTLIVVGLASFLSNFQRRIKDPNEQHSSKSTKTQHASIVQDSSENTGPARAQKSYEFLRYRQSSIYSVQGDARLHAVRTTHLDAGALNPNKTHIFLHNHSNTSTLDYFSPRGPYFVFALGRGLCDLSHASTLVKKPTRYQDSNEAK